MTAAGDGEHCPDCRHRADLHVPIVLGNASARIVLCAASTPCLCYAGWDDLGRAVPMAADCVLALRQVFGFLQPREGDDGLR